MSICEVGCAGHAKGSLTVFRTTLGDCEYATHALASQGVWLKGIDVAKAAGWGNHDLAVRRQVDGDDKRTLRELGVNSPDGSTCPVRTH